jgi:hypothetical protein
MKINTQKNAPRSVAQFPALSRKFPKNLIKKVDNPQGPYYIEYDA